MSIDVSCLSYQGQKLFVTCSRTAPFHARVHRFYRHLQELRGILGTVEEPGHACDGFWFVCFDRCTNRGCNFTNRWGGFNMYVCPEEPVPDKWPADKKEWPYWIRRGEPSYYGHGFIFESREWMQRILPDILEAEERRHERDTAQRSAPDAGNAESGQHENPPCPLDRGESPALE